MSAFLGLTALGDHPEYESLSDLQELALSMSTAIEEEGLLELLGGITYGGHTKERVSYIEERERDLKRREEELNRKEQTLAMREKSTRSPVPDPQNALLCNDELLQLYSTYDVDGDGLISRKEFRDDYRNFEEFGVCVTERHLDTVFSQFGSGDRISFNEFCILMLQRAKM